jgi:hypothetical protein
MSILQNWFCLPVATAEAVLGNNQVPLNTLTASCAPIIVPIELIAFHAEKLNEADAHLTWSTASEQNTAYFDIERSHDALNFKKIASKNAAGHSHALIHYDLVDKNLDTAAYQKYYYRLKMVDLDGAFTYSEIRAVVYDKNRKAIDFVVSPNPSTNGIFTLNFNQDLDERSELEIAVTDVYGRLVLSERFPVEGNRFYCDALSGLAAGNYYISVQGMGFQKTAKWIVV